jgi:hypothetical protein
MADRLITAGRPMCAVCGKLVERMVEYYVTFDESEMAERKMRVDPSAGVAFQVRRLGE